MKPAVRETVSALDRGLALMHCFGAGHDALGPSDLARLTGIPRPSVARLAATLVAHRLLRPAPDGERYMLGSGVVSLAQAFLAGLDVRAAARGPMQELAERTGGSVYLALRDALEMVIVEACKPRSSMLASRIGVGTRVPMPNSALGRAWLGAVDPQARVDLLAELRQAHRRDWPALEAGLNRALAERQRHGGLCISAGEFHHEINSVSVAWVDARGETITFNCGGPAFQFPVTRLRNEVGPALMAMVQRLADDLGGHLAVPDKGR